MLQVWQLFDFHFRAGALISLLKGKPERGTVCFLVAAPAVSCSSASAGSSEEQLQAESHQHFPKTGFCLGAPTGSLYGN